MQRRVGRRAGLSKDVFRGDWRVVVGVTAAVAVLTACGNAPNDEVTGDSGGAARSNAIEIDGSSTVAPITDAVAEEFNLEQPAIQVNVGVSGTGGGFERFCNGETDISDASRAIKDEEREICQANGVEFVELKVGTDALTMVTSPQTDFVTCLTTEQVARIFGPKTPASSWKDVDPALPDQPLEVFAPGRDSGTYDFMVEDVLGLEAARQDYSAAEDDNIIAQGVQGTVGAWGFFGFAYYVENAQTIKALEYDAGDGCVAPSVQTAQDGSYGMTRPLFIYVNARSLERRVVQDFVRFYLNNAAVLVEEIGYIPEPDYGPAMSTFEEAVGA
jgi:phosphate transport system substrate-binding protein